MTPSNIYKGEYGTDVKAPGPILISGIEINAQSNHGILLSDYGVRGCAAREYRFEGNTQGVLKTDSGTDITGFVHFFGNRCFYANITGSDAAKLFISEDVGENFHAHPDQS